MSVPIVAMAGSLGGVGFASHGMRGTLGRLGLTLSFHMASLAWDMQRF